VQVVLGQDAHDDLVEVAAVVEHGVTAAAFLTESGFAIGSLSAVVERQHSELDAVLFHLVEAVADRDLVASVP